MPLPESIGDYLRLCGRPHKRKYVPMSVMGSMALKCASCMGLTRYERHIRQLLGVGSQVAQARQGIFAVEPPLLARAT